MSGMNSMFLNCNGPLIYTKCLVVMMELVLEPFMAMFFYEWVYVGHITWSLDLVLHVCINEFLPEQ